MVAFDGMESNAVFKSDTQLEMDNINNGEAWFAKLWTTDCMPADNSGETDGATRATGLGLANGTVLRLVDMPPGGRSPMHRTYSIDYGVALSGKVHLELDRGKTFKLLPNGSRLWRLKYRIDGREN